MVKRLTLALVATATVIGIAATTGTAANIVSAYNGGN